jgi:hypothetical protein
MSSVGSPGAKPNRSCSRRPTRISLARGTNRFARTAGYGSLGESVGNRSNHQVKENGLALSRVLGRAL